MNDRVVLERFGYTPLGTFGRLLLPEFQCYTVERPWLNNRVRLSCIPEGDYIIRLGTYHRGGYPAYEVLGVEGRSLIKIHIGNTMDDVVGCIAPGADLGYLNGKWAVVNSRPAFKAFMEAMGGRAEAAFSVTRQAAGAIRRQVRLVSH